MSIFLKKPEILVGIGKGDTDVEYFEPFSSYIMSPVGNEAKNSNPQSSFPVSHCYYLSRGSQRFLLGFCVNNYREVKSDSDIPIYNMAKVQTYETLLKMGIATMVLSHKILRLITINEGKPFKITALIEDDAKTIWNDGEPHADGTPSYYVYKKIFKKDSPIRQGYNWVDEIVLEGKDREYYEALYNKKEQQLIKNYKTIESIYYGKKLI